MKMVSLLFLCSLTVYQLFAQQISFPLEIIAANNLFNNRQFAAFDLNGKIHISYTGQQGTNSATREIYYVYESGAGFSDTINISSNAVDDNYSTLSVDRNNKVHIGFLGRDAGNLFQIKYTNNISGNFLTPVFLTTGGLNKATPYSKIGPDSVMHFVYFTFTNDPDNVYYIKHDLRTNVTSSPVVLTGGETSGDFDASLDVDRNGKVHILVKSGSALGGPLKYYSDISGTVTEYPLPVSANVTTAKIITDRNNKVHITYRLESELRLYYTTNTAGSFSTPVAITPAGQRPSGMQNISIDDSLRLYVIYQSSASTSGKGFYLVYGQNGIFTDTMLVYELTPEYVTRNSSVVIAKGNGNIATLFTPGGVVNSVVIANIFMKRGNLFEPIPVELISFNWNETEFGIRFNWSTASETNNRGFELQIKETDGWQSIAFIPGRVNSTQTSDYSYELPSKTTGQVFRLKQIDFDGSFHFSNELTVNLGNIADDFSVVNTYPNPFNPEVNIQFTLAGKSETLITVYDLLGNKIAVIYEGELNKGIHYLKWNAGGFSSGVYIIQVQAADRETGNPLRTLRKKVLLSK